MRTTTLPKGIGEHRASTARQVLSVRAYDFPSGGGGGRLEREGRDKGKEGRGERRRHEFHVEPPNQPNRREGGATCVPPSLPVPSLHSRQQRKEKGGKKRNRELLWRRWRWEKGNVTLLPTWREEEQEQQQVRDWPPTIEATADCAKLDSA